MVRILHYILLLSSWRYNVWCIWRFLYGFPIRSVYTDNGSLFQYDKVWSKVAISIDLLPRLHHLNWMLPILQVSIPIMPINCTMHALSILWILYDLFVVTSYTKVLFGAFPPYSFHFLSSIFYTTLLLVSLCLLLPLISPLLFPCARYPVSDPYLVLGIPGPYCLRYMVSCMSDFFRSVFVSTEDDFQLII